jgi:threonine/homoserine/homoserine lactone efflux protein
MVSYPPVTGGVLFSTVFNPTVVLWWATIGFATLMDAFLVASFAGVVFWLIGHYLADFGWFSFISYSVAKGRKFIGASEHRVLLTACSVILLVLGTYLVLKYGSMLL